jgi:transglutaminase-like putative cysteine protease
MQNQETMVAHANNLKPTAILDFESEEIRELARSLRKPGQNGRSFLQKAHLMISRIILPVYSVDEWQPASRTSRDGKGSCSQRMACLEALARAVGIPTRVRALHVKGEFWFPRFPVAQWFIPRRILLAWPQFCIDETWTDFDELHGTAAELAAAAPQGFKNDGESLFEAVGKMPVDFLGKTCGLACARPEHNLSGFVLEDAGFFDSRDEAFGKFGSFQYTLRGRFFELLYGGRKSS